MDERECRRSLGQMPMQRVQPAALRARTRASAPLRPPARRAPLRLRGRAPSARPRRTPQLAPPQVLFDSKSLLSCIQTSAALPTRQGRVDQVRRVDAPQRGARLAQLLVEWQRQRGCRPGNPVHARRCGGGQRQQPQHAPSADGHARQEAVQAQQHLPTRGEGDQAGGGAVNCLPARYACMCSGAGNLCATHRVAVAGVAPTCMTGSLPAVPAAVASRLPPAVRMPLLMSTGGVSRVLGRGKSGAAP